MTPNVSTIHDPADRGESQTQHRCLYCDRIIPDLPDMDLTVWLDVKLGLVSDEIALVCNACTAQLIEMRAREAPVAGRRR